MTVEDIRVEPDGTVSFRTGPSSHDKRHHLVDTDETSANNYVVVPQIGPIDYPDTYDHGPAAPLPRFIRHFPEIRLDPEAPGDASRGETYCFDCSFRPWIDFGEASQATVTVIAGRRREQVPATLVDGRWRTQRALGSGESASVGRGCVMDQFGNFNGTPSAAVGADSGARATECHA
jgi:hypothetical protein